MVDLPGFSSKDTAKPPGVKQLLQEERDFRAFAIWSRTQSEGKVREALNLKTNAEARIRINRGREMLQEHRADLLDEMRDRDIMLLNDMTTKLAEAFFGGDMSRTADLIKVMERRAKLLGTDAEKEDAGGPQVVVIDSRAPWERPDVVEGSAEDVEPPALPSAT